MALSEALRAALAGPAELSPRDIADLRADLGVRPLAEALAGTTDHNSRAYKSARDQLSRYARGGRKAAPARTDRLRGIAQRLRTQRLRAAGAAATIAGNVTVNGSDNDTRFRVVSLDGGRRLTGADLTPTLNLANRGDWEGAADAFQSAAARRWGFPPDAVEFADTERVTLT
jgi:hypothetical protein